MHTLIKARDLPGRRLLLLGLLPFACAGGQNRPSPPLAATLIIRGAAVFDGERALGPADVAVDGERIVAVGPQLAVAASAQVVDGKGMTLLPGLVDAHAHIWDELALEKQLVFGVTTVLDMAGDPARARPLRAAAAGSTALADFRGAGNPVVAPGGVGTQYNVAYDTLADSAQTEAFVDAIVAAGSDYVKLMTDDLSALGLPRTVPTLDRDTITRAIARAHHHHKLALVHVTQRADAETAIAAGADGLAHLFADAPADPPLVAKMQQQGLFVITTLVAMRTLAGEAGGAALAADPDIQPYLDQRDTTNLTTVPAALARTTKLRSAHAAASAAALAAAGVDLLVGTDSPNPGSSHGASMHDELALLVAAGLTPAAALRSATATPARRFGLADRGRIAAGLRADLLLVEGDPLADITRTRHITGVWRGGVAYDREAWRQKLAAQRR